MGGSEAAPLKASLNLGGGERGWCRREKRANPVVKSWKCRSRDSRKELSPSLLSGDGVPP